MLHFLQQASRFEGSYSGKERRVKRRVKRRVRRKGTTRGEEEDKGQKDMTKEESSKK